MATTCLCEHVLRCRLRRADGGADGAVEELTAVVAQIGPDTKILVRGDSGS